METTTSKGKEIRIPGPDHPIKISPAEGRVRVTVAGRMLITVMVFLEVAPGFDRSPRCRRKSFDKMAMLAGTVKE
jgi:hypothetical protein